MNIHAACLFTFIATEIQSQGVLGVAWLGRPPLPGRGSSYSVFALPKKFLLFLLTLLPESNKFWRKRFWENEFAKNPEEPVDAGLVRSFRYV